MLASFLFTAKQQRVIASLMLRPQARFSLTELLNAAGGGRSPTQNYVKALVDAQVVITSRERRAVRYQANTSHPLFPELSSIAVKSFGLSEPIEEGLASLHDRIKEAFIFGSMAKA